MTAAMRPHRGCRRGASRFATCLVLALMWVLAVGSSAHASEGEWSVRLEPMHMRVLGHDQHVLTIHEIDTASTPRSDHKTAMDLDTESGLAYRGECQYTRGQWGWGVDFFWFNTSQGMPNLSAAGGIAGAADEVVFEIAGQGFTSRDPSEVLFYGVLEDTDVAAWTLDLYGIRTLTQEQQSTVRLQFGLRLGDFDNDFRAVAGLQDVVGSRLDASSNYDLMMGPLVGLAGDVRFGRNRIEGYIGQSVLLGSVELDHMARRFTGPFTSAFPVETTLPAETSREMLHARKDVAIPITELRIKWTYRVTRHVALGLGADTSAWWEVSVPPGVVPIEDGDDALLENTLVFFGLLGSIELEF